MLHRTAAAFVGGNRNGASSGGHDDISFSVRELLALSEALKVLPNDDLFLVPGEVLWKENNFPL